MYFKFKSGHYAFHTCLIITFYTAYSSKARASSIATADILDLSFPILVSDRSSKNDPLYDDSSTTHFGYTVSLAEGVSGSKSSEDPHGWIFIGAPKANASKSFYDSSGTNEPGIIWRCSLGKRSGDDCMMVNVDPPQVNKKMPPGIPVSQNYNGAWIGASMEINNDRFVTCGMRWNRGKNQYYNGICYWFADSSRADKSSYKSSDLSNLVNRNLQDQRLTPFFLRTSNEDTVFKFVTSSNQSSNGHEWQLSQAGVSVHLFLETNSTTSPNLLIGAPGVREYSGAVVLYTNAAKPQDEMERPNRNPSDPTFSEFVVGNRGIIPHAGDTRKTYWNEYFGYSVSSGRYFSRNKVLYAGGAPRSELNGVVVIFDFPPYDKLSSTYKRQIRPILTIKAPNNSFASYFGSVLHTLIDVDGNGIDVLAVGAPLYSFSSSRRSVDQTSSVEVEKEKLKIKVNKVVNNFQKSGDQGCVLIYKFKETESNMAPNYSPLPTQILVGRKTPWARFGSAISSFVFKLNYANGTLIKENYLVIGAPYEISDDGSDSTGAVYLYRYNIYSLKFDTNVIQRIVASKISSSLKGFGSSFSIPRDIDANGTPDLGIGSYKSGQVVILRSRPRIFIQGWVTFVSSEGEETTEIRRGVSKFTLKSCFNVAEIMGVVALDLDIWIRIKFLDPSIRFDDERVKERPGNTENEIVYKRTVEPHAKKICQDFVIHAVHKDGIGMDDSDSLTEIKHPFHFIQEVWYNETENRPLSVVNYFTSGTNPVAIDGTQKITLDTFDSRKPAFHHFKNYADLPVTLKDCKNQVCRPNILISWTFYNKNNEPISAYTVGSDKEITLRIVVANSGETAEKPIITLDWKNTYITESDSAGARWLHKTCTERSKTTYACPLGPYIRPGRNKTIEIQLNMKDIFVTQPNMYDFVINGAVSFPDTHIPIVTSDARLVILIPGTSVLVTGSKEEDTLNTPSEYSVQDESTSTRTETLYAYIRQRFTMEVLGASVTTLEARFRFPIFNGQETNSKQLILVKQPQVNHNGVTCKVTQPKFSFYTIQQVGAPVPSDVSFQAPNSAAHSSQQDLVSLPMEVAIQRRRRDAILGEWGNDTTTTSRQAIAIDMKPPNKPKKQTPMKVDSEKVLTLSCHNSEASCMEVTCTGTNIQANRHLHIAFDMYPVKDVFDKLLQTKEKSSILIESSGFATIFNADVHHKDNDVSQTLVSPISGKQVGTWVYFVASGGGILLLAFIILGLYKCGFFKREKREQLNHMKAEHHRKSMVATARASMIQSSSARSSTAVSGYASQSQENLTEAEHQNEDMEPDEEKPQQATVKKDEE